MVNEQSTGKENSLLYLARVQSNCTKPHNGQEYYYLLFFLMQFCHGEFFFSFEMNFRPNSQL